MGCAGHRFWALVFLNSDCLHPSFQDPEWQHILGDDFRRQRDNDVPQIASISRSNSTFWWQDRRVRISFDCYGCLLKDLIHRAIFNWASNEIRGCIGFSYFAYLIGPENRALWNSLAAFLLWVLIGFPFFRLAVVITSVLVLGQSSEKRSRQKNLWRQFPCR